MLAQNRDEKVFLEEAMTQRWLVGDDIDKSISTVSWLSGKDVTDLGVPGSIPSSPWKFSQLENYSTVYTDWMIL